MRNIYLVGFMGGGKTSVGRQLAKRTQRAFIDLDERIELREKRKISDIFEKDGESSFRRIEKEQLREVVLEDDRVVACGGGIVTDSENISIMRSTGKIICLSASVEVIFARTRRHAHRPLLRVEDPIEQIKSLLAKRAPLYAQADVTIDTSALSVEEVVDKIISL